MNRFYGSTWFVLISTNKYYFGTWFCDSKDFCIHRMLGRNLELKNLGSYSFKLRAETGLALDKITPYKWDRYGTIQMKSFKLMRITTVLVLLLVLGAYLLKNDLAFFFLFNPDPVGSLVVGGHLWRKKLLLSILEKFLISNGQVEQPFKGENQNYLIPSHI